MCVYIYAMKFIRDIRSKSRFTLKFLYALVKFRSPLLAIYSVFSGCCHDNGKSAGIYRECSPICQYCFNALIKLEDGRVEKCDLLIITQVSLLSRLPVEDSSTDLVLSLGSSFESPSDQLFEEISRVLKPGGTILPYHSWSATADTMKTISALELKLLLPGFLEAQLLQPKSILGSDVQSLMIKAKQKKRPSWKIDSSFAIKNAPKSSPVVQIDADSDLIDEDSLLTEEDLKKPELPLVGDCEVGATRKACKNCTCGRAEAEQKIEKLGLTNDLLNNP